MSNDNSFSSTITTTNKNLSRLSKTVASTATTLMSSSYNDLSNTHYQTAMKEIARRPVFQKRLFSFNARRAPSEFVKSSLSRSEIQYRAVTSIPEELLHNIPNDTNKFSLFQGFQASTEGIDEDNKSTTKNNSSFSSKLLKDKSKPLPIQKDLINHQLDLLEIRKDLAANEIKEIDQRIQFLNSTRAIVFERIAELEQEELKLEAELDQITIKLEKDQSRGNSIDTPNSPATPENEEGWSDLDEQSTSKEEPIIVEDGPLLSQSIYGKLQSASSSSPKESSKPHKKHHQQQQQQQQQQPRPRSRRQSHSKRKTMPTLQQFYSPGQNIRTIDAHNDSITAIDFDIPFGTMVSSSLDDSVTVWDLSKGTRIRQLTGHNASVKCLQMENNIIATGSVDATVKLWDLSIDNEEQLNDNCCIETFQAHLGEITALHFYDNTLVSGSADKTIRQWDLQTGRCLQTLDVLWASAQGGGFNGYEDNRWRRKTMNESIIESSSLQSDYDFVGALQCFDAALATGTADGIVRLWDLRTGQVHRSLLGHTGPVTCLQFDDHHLATGSLDRSIRIWDLRTGTIFDAFAYESPITSLHFDPRRIVSANKENTVKIYDREIERHWTCGAGEEDNNASIVNNVRYREGYLVEGRQDGKIGIWAC